MSTVPMRIDATLVNAARAAAKAQVRTVRGQVEFLAQVGRAAMDNPPHPGAVLQEWLAEVSVTQAATQLGVTRAYLSRILHGHADISADMALRLSDLLGTSAEMWLGMQSAYDLWQAAQQPRPVVQRMTVVA